jgi:hypothetical protein
MIYYAAKERAKIAPEDRFKEKYLINNETGCWDWQNATNNIGYGMFRWDRHTMRLAHRASYEIHVGSIPKGLCVCHKCDNPKCVNPEHLWLGTKRQSYDDMMSKGRHVPGMLGKKHKHTTCNNCGYTGPVVTVARNHNDKCKTKR